MIEFQHDSIDESLERRRLLCVDVEAFCADSLTRSQFRCREGWRVTLGGSLLFDRAGLKAIARAIVHYSGSAARLGFALNLSADALRDYYSHNDLTEDGKLLLPIEAVRTHGVAASEIEILDVVLPELVTSINSPQSLTPPYCNRTPLALLLPYSCDHDLLFANQIAIISNVAARVRRAPWSWLRGLFARGQGSLRRRIPLYWNRVDPTALIHPTAVIEGSIIGAGCRIGAGCVVRYSVLGQEVRLHDGAKVEYSAVDDRSWLMHDLVLCFSVAERDVFLIHGPYQFSYFQHTSAAFASIMMDYRPDTKDIVITTPGGRRHYKGRFLGAVLEERARVFAGTLTAPGITIPAGRDVFSEQNVVRTRDLMSST